MAHLIKFMYWANTDFSEEKSRLEMTINVLYMGQKSQGEDEQQEKMDR
jgi:hypothetical protein